jgi:hypothetical protein
MAHARNEKEMYNTAEFLVGNETPCSVPNREFHLTRWKILTNTMKCHAERPDLREFEKNSDREILEVNARGMDRRGKTHPADRPGNAVNDTCAVIALTARPATMSAM